MTRVRNAKVGLWALSLVLMLQTGCDWVNRPIVYEDARESPPLKVPENLVTPAPNPALQIPPVAGVAPSVVAEPPTLGNTVAAARTDLPRAANAVLSLDDESQSTWRRVGIAIERSGCCRVLDKNAAELSYQVELNSAARAKPGFFKRIFGGGAPASVMTVKVAAVDTSSTVTVVDAEGQLRRDDAAMSVLGVIEARLR